MGTESPSKAKGTTYVIPPVSLEFSIGQLSKTCFQVDVFCRSGNHCFTHRQIRSYYDQLDVIPAIVGSSMLSWVLWLTEFEAERRAQSQGRQRQLRLAFPDWPSGLDEHTVYDPHNDYTG